MLGKFHIILSQLHTDIVVFYLLNFLNEDFKINSLVTIVTRGLF